MDKKIKIVAVFAPAGAGKDFVLKDYFTKSQCGCINQKANEVISDTTRPLREKEINGEAYYFRSKEEFEINIGRGRYLEHTEFRGWYYGTSIESLDPDCINIGVFNVAGVKALLKDERVEIFPVFISCSNKTRLLRQLNREEHPDVDEIIRRFKTDKKDFDKIDFEYHTIFNETYQCQGLQLADYINSIE